MVKVAGFPILLHIMSHYIKHGFKNFYIAAGYKDFIIKNILKNIKKMENFLITKFLIENVE